jgi:hypothetical protein
MTEMLTESRLSTEEVDFSWAFVLREGTLHGRVC